MALNGSLSVSSISSYIDRHPEIAFIVYRDYDVLLMQKVKPRENKSDITPEATHTSEIIQPVTEDLIDAVTSFLQWKENYSDIAETFKTSKALSSPYLVIYHSKNEMKDFLGGLTNEQRRQFQALLDYVLLEYSGEYSAVDSLLHRRRITYPYIKYLFKPGDVLVEESVQNVRGFLSKSWLESFPYDTYSKGSGNSSKKALREKWAIEAWSWKFNGAFARQNFTLSLELDPNDRSEMEINALNVRPLAYTSEKVERTLRQRGEIYWKCRIRHFVSYHEDLGRDFHHSGDDRYMIDLKMYKELHKAAETNPRWTPEEVFTDELGTDAMENETPPAENFVYLLPLTIKGYNLKTKKWLELQVDRIAEVVWNKEAFEGLVFDPKTKRLIKALISNQLEEEASTDLISGKGNGKTLTAESVAEIAEKPLYPVTCGDIGTEAEDVENYLESVLNLGKTWGCVVLLDEADVFLEQRSLEDLQRNALVSVFLRVLEYYDGILVLTSNRVGTFDEAFKSRIQLALHYPNLGAHQRERIWENFIKRLENLKEEKVDFEDIRYHVKELAKNKMNGRQIRNVITLARQFAKQDNQTLDYSLLKDIMETAGRFDVYIEKLNGGYSQDDLAEEEGLRLSKAP
jgi:hypothetical protein